MRCPNCGNENPADYVFCDECGARLQPMADTGQADSASSTMSEGSPVAEMSEMPVMSAVPGDSAGMAGGMAAGSDSISSGDSVGSDGQTSAASSGSSDSTGGWQPPPTSDVDQAAWQSPMPPSSTASGSDAAAPTSQDATAVSVGSPGWNVAGMRSTGAFDDDEDETSEADANLAAMTADEGGDVPTYNAWDRPGAMSTISVDSGSDDEEPVPATEDTMGDSASSGMSTGGADMSYGGQQQEEMPGVVPMVGTYGEDSGASATGGGIAAGGDDWLNATMRYMDEAQSALDKLRSHLSSGSSGAASAGTSLDAGSDFGAVMPGSPSGMMSGIDSSQPAGGAGDYSSGGTGMSNMGNMGNMADMSGSTGSSTAGSSTIDTGYSAPDMSAAVSPPILEPAAEAGSLGASSIDMDSGLAGMDSSMAGAGGQAAVQEAPASSGEPVMARLVVIATGAEMPLPDQEEITVGREDPSSGIFPDVDLTPYGGEDGGVSRRHAKLLRIGDDFFVEDLQSTNYTKLDGQRLPAHVRERVEDGARLDFGRVATIFRRG